MKIVILGTRGFPNIQGGVEKHCEGLACALVKLNCDTIVFTRKPYVVDNARECHGVRLVCLPTIRHKTTETVIHTFIGIFAALYYRPDILHIQAIGPALFTPLARLLGMKVVVTTHGVNYMHKKWGWFAKLVLRIGEYMGAKFSNEMIAISAPIAEGIKTKYNKTAHVISNGVFSAETVDTVNMLHKFELEKDRYILSVGRLVLDKGFHVLIDAFINLSEAQSQISRERWKLVLVGEADHKGPYSRSLKKKAGKHQNIVLTGFLKSQALNELYSYTGLFVLPSFYEGLPIVLLEAMSYGASCIASDIQGNRNIPLSEDRYFPPGDPAALAEKVLQMIKKPLSEEEKKEQKLMISKNFNWQTAGKKTLEIYKKVIEKKP